MANGRGDWHEEFLWGTVAMLFVAIYTGFIKHVWGHVRASDVEEAKLNVKELGEVVQYKTTCEAIEKRMDQQNKTTHEMLTRVLDSVERLEQTIIGKG